MIKIIKIVNGYLEENCYVVHNGTDALVIDPGSEGERIISEIDSNNLNVKAILITHYHFDHIGALKDIKERYNVPVIDYNSKETEIELSSFKFKILETFGHTMDSVSYHFENDNILFSGDFMFKETIGNYEEKNEIEMIKSLIKFKLLDDKIEIYPGHGDSTTVAHEKEYNPFLRGI